MKKKLLLFFALVCGMQAMATNLVFVKTNGTEQLQDIAAIGKWVFVGETSLQLLDHSGLLLADEPLDGIRKITFAEPSVPSAVENALQEGQIVVYPNPTHDVLIVQGVEGAQVMRVYDLQGRLLKTANANEVNVSDLANGTYLLQIGTQVVRFIKQ